MTSQGEWHATLDFSVKNYEHLKTVHEVTSDFTGVCPKRHLFRYNISRVIRALALRSISFGFFFFYDWQNVNTNFDIEFVKSCQNA